jgi:hypothetical protein
MKIVIDVKINIITTRNLRVCTTEFFDLNMPDIFATYIILKESENP